jgi:hypothetical protein
MTAPVPERVRRHRAGQRATGLRPVRNRVPDTRCQGFAAECRRQSRLLRDDPQEREVLDWLEAAADTKGWR